MPQLVTDSFAGPERSRDEPELARLLARIDALEGRDFQLLSIVALVVLVLGSSTVAFLFPDVAWGLGPLIVEGRYLPQLLYGFVSLIVLFNVYVFDQRRRLRATRRALVRELARSESAERRSLIDPLTETFNRRYLEELLPQEVSRVERRKGSLGFLMIDIDDFRSVNNRHGHAVGDRLLREAAAVLRAIFRRSDSIVRYGGDEFLVLLDDADEERARVTVERVRDTVIRWRDGQHELEVGISCGVAIFRPGDSVDATLAAADRAMFEAKRRARHPSSGSPAATA